MNNDNFNYDIKKIKSSLRGNGKVAIVYTINAYREEVYDFYLNVGTRNEKVIYNCKSLKQGAYKYCKSVNSFAKYNKVMEAMMKAPRYLKNVDIIPTDPQREEECWQDR